MYANPAAASPLSLPFSCGRRSHGPIAETLSFSPLFSLPADCRNIHNFLSVRFPLPS